MSYTYVCNIVLLPSDTGLTDLSAQLKTAAGVNSGSAITTGFTELTLGNYLWTTTISDDSFRGFVAFSSGGVLQATAVVEPPSSVDLSSIETQLDAIQDKTDLITANTVTVVSPVLDSDSISIVRGDDYNADDSRELTWSSGDWVDLTGATVSFSARNKQTGSTDLTLTASVDDAGEATQIIIVELTSAQTSTLTVGEDIYLFDIQAELASGNIVTLVRGTMTVTEDVSTED